VADSWQLARSELELGEELGHGFFGTVNRGLWRHQVDRTKTGLHELAEIRI
jgi:hypothetical protein